MYSVAEVNNSSGRIVSIANGLNQKIEYNYKPLTDTSVYRKTAKVTYPLSIQSGPVYVVSELKTDNGIGGQTTIEYSYEDAIVHKQGKGFLGFEKITQTNTASNVSVVTQSEFNLQYFTLAKQITTTSDNNGNVSQITNTFNIIPYSNKHIFSYLGQSVTKDFLKNNTTLSTYTYDKIGNLTEQRSYYNFPYNYPLNMAGKAFSNFDSYGNPAKIITVLTRQNEPYFMQQQTFVYNDKGKISSATLNGSTTSFTYDTCGNTLTVTSSAAGLEDRVITSEYDKSGRFLTK